MVLVVVLQLQVLLEQLPENVQYFYQPLLILALFVVLDIGKTVKTVKLVLPIVMFVPLALILLALMLPYNSMLMRLVHQLLVLLIVMNVIKINALQLVKDII